MKYTSIFSLGILSSILYAPAENAGAQNISQNSSHSYAASLLSGAPDGLYAVIELGQGMLFLDLFYTNAPITVTSFVGLATGKFSEHVSKKGRYFDGLSFHRVVDNFVIQGGDPTASGTGGPGYSFINEIDARLNFNEPGMLAMANAGADTNGSQFFITLAPTPHLQGAYTIFGKLIKGSNLVKKVREGDKIKSISIIPIGTKPKEYLNTISWDNFQDMLAEVEKEKSESIAQKKKSILSELANNKSLQSTKDQIFYSYITKGSGKKINDGDEVEVHYQLVLYGSDRVLDSSYDRGESFQISVGSNRVIKGWELILRELKEGDKARVIIPPDLAYGSTGIPPSIPPEAFLEFIIEIIKIK